MLLARRCGCAFENQLNGFSIESEHFESKNGHMCGEKKQVHIVLTLAWHSAFKQVVNHVFI